jgi:CheY-like chemotaxis protein
VQRAGLLFLYSSPGEQAVTILIVDDNAAIRRLIRRAIAHLASEVYECADGADALTAYSDYRPDLVFMDIRMPRMDGLEATRQIIRAHPSARIVIVTDYDEEQLKIAALDAGAEGYALKDNLSDLEAFVVKANTN